MPTNKKRGLGQSNICLYVYVRTCVLKDAKIGGVKASEKRTRLLESDQSVTTNEGYGTEPKGDVRRTTQSR